ncbi:MAG: hypothetical protein H6537_00295 [Bacteroidales bacterium]|nr:hypothetical protein [Bacteroidales bacterium]
MQQGNIIVAYKGAIDADLIADTLTLIETKLERDVEHSLTRKKIYNVMVECLQNLFHHVDAIPNTGNLNYGIFVLSKLPNGFYIATGNMVNVSKKPVLKQKIDKINSLNKDELKEFYKFVLNNQTFSEKGGGGLGLIDIARKTGSKLNYSFVPFNDSLDFFKLSVILTE